MSNLKAPLSFPTLFVLLMMDHVWADAYRLAHLRLPIQWEISDRNFLP